jgi:chaperonin GroES
MKKQDAPRFLPPAAPETLIRLLDDRVAIIPKKAPDRSEGGIYLPAAAQEQQQEGEVWCVGPGKLDENGNRIKMQIDAGDRVIFGKYGGVEVELDGRTLRIVRESDVMAVFMQSE